MKKLAALPLAGLAATALFCAPATAQDCDRACLLAVLDAYLGALTSGDPDRAPVAESYRATEDGAEVRLGEGLWTSLSGLGAYRIDMVDPASGNVGVIAEALESEASALFALRLHVVRGEITEIETIVGRARVPGGAGVPSPRPSLAEAAPEAERLSREQMIETANANFDAILAADGAIYDESCQRIENRVAMSGDEELDYPIATLPGVEKPDFGAMGCREQIEAHLFDQLDEVEPRRFVLLDEEKQLVFGVYMMRWYKNGRCNEIPNYGRICPDPDRPRAPVALLNAEILGVRGGRIHEIEAVFKFADYDSDSGWSGDVRDEGGSENEATGALRE